MTDDIKERLRRTGEWGHDGMKLEAAARIAALEAERDALREALAEAREALAADARELETFDDDAVCDHSVGICWCGYWRAREGNKAALAHIGRVLGEDGNG